MHGSHFPTRNDVLLHNKAINAPEWNLVMYNSFGFVRIFGGVRRMIADFSLMLRLSCSAPHSHPAVIPTHDLELYLTSHHKCDYYQQLSQHRTCKLQGL